MIEFIIYYFLKLIYNNKINYIDFTSKNKNRTYIFFEKFLLNRETGGVNVKIYQ